MVGDSFTEGSQVKLEETTPKRLEKRLNDMSDKSYEVINFGVGGDGLIPEAIRIEEEVIKYDPDMVILSYFVGNDLTEIGCGAIKAIPDDFWLDEKHESLKKEIYKLDTGMRRRIFLTKNSMLYYMFHRAVRSKEKSGETISPIYEKEYRDDLRKNLHTTELVFQFLKKLTSKHKINLLVVIIPAKEQVEKDIFMEKLKESDASVANYELEKPQNVISEILKSLKIDYIDILPKLREHNLNNTFYWQVDTHFNKEGYEKTADIIFEHSFKEKPLQFLEPLASRHFCSSCPVSAVHQRGRDTIGRFR